MALSIIEASINCFVPSMYFDILVIHPSGFDLKDLDIVGNVRRSFGSTSGLLCYWTPEGGTLFLRLARSRDPAILVASFVAVCGREGHQTPTSYFVKVLIPGQLLNKSIRWNLAQPVANGTWCPCRLYSSDVACGNTSRAPSRSRGFH